MTIGFAIIWLFAFPTDLILLIVLFVLMSIYDRRRILKRLGLLETNDVKIVKGSSNHYFNHRLHFQCLVTEAAAHKANTSVCLVGMSTKKYLVLNADQR